MRFLERLTPGTTLWHMRRSLRIVGPLDRTALADAFRDLEQRHESLRTRLPTRDGVAVQEIGEAAVELPIHDLRALGTAEREVQLASLHREQARAFDLEQGPLWRVAIAGVAADEHVLWFTVHHIIFDTWSMGIFCRELDALYTARVAQQPPRLAPLPVQYADYATWEHEQFETEDHAQQLSYWRDRLSDLPAVELPIDRPSPSVRSSRGGYQPFEVPADVAETLRELCASEDATPYMGLLTAFNTLLARYGGTDTIAVATPVANRLQRQTRAVIGLFVNTIVLRTDLSGEPSFREALQRVREVVLDGLAHQDVPFDRVVEAVRPSRGGASTPLFNVMFSLHGEPAPMKLGALAVEDLWGWPTEAAFDLTLNVIHRSGLALRGWLEYDADLFEPATAESLARDYVQLLREAVHHPTKRLAEISVVTDGERSDLVRGWKATERALPSGSALGQIEAQAARIPQATAVIGEHTKLTYSELDARANRLAHHLRALGASPEVPIAVALPRSPELVVALLAVWKAGAPYVPLDPHHPYDRLRYIIEDAGVRLVVTETSLAGFVPDGRTIIALDRDAATVADRPATRPAGDIAPMHLAYLLYTSGTTGRPKGVEVEHESLQNFLASMRREPGLRADDTLLAITTVSFDIAGLELWLPLSTGAKVAVASSEDALDPIALAHRIEETGATILQATPTTWQLLVASGWKGQPQLVALCGGEALPAELARALVPKVRALWNMYGPTETTIWSAARRVEADVPILLGGPIDNTRLYVLDRWRNLTPIGAAGELYIGGEGVARGYVGRPDVTAERFVPDPFGPPGSRMYRTGDVLRRLADGSLAFLGRVDHQVKIRGFRIELGEIERVASEHPSVRQVVVVARKGGAAGATLVAYIVPGEGFEPAVLRAHLAEQLPDYMLPAALVTLDALPLSTAGKVDRKALPAPPEDAYARHVYAAPRTPEEERIAEIWREMLAVERVGIHDDFFALGGHSLLALRLVAEIERALGVRLPLRDVFRVPTVGALAQEVSSGRHGQVTSSRPRLNATEARKAPIVAPQRGTFFLDRDAPNNRMNRLSWSYWIDGAAHDAALERALAALRERHSILRTRFYEADGQLWQEVLESRDLAFALLERADLSSLSADEIERADRGLEDCFAQRPFDLGSGQVVRALLVTLSPTRHRLTVSLHRIVCDAQSARIFVAELEALWRTLCEAPDRDAMAVLPSAARQYIDLADYLARLDASDVGAQQRAFWSDRLADAVPLELPIDHPRDGVEARRNEKAGFVTFPAGYTSEPFGRDALIALEQLARRTRASLQSTLMAAMVSHLSGLTGQTDIAIVTYLNYRHLPGFETSLGLFANPLIIRVSAAGAPTPHELVQRTHEVVTSSFEHGEYDVLGLASPRCFRCCINYVQIAPSAATRGVPAGAVSGLALTPAEPRVVEVQRMAYDVMLFLYNYGDRLEISLAYNRELFSTSGARALLRGYVQHVEAMCRDAAY